MGQAQSKAYTYILTGILYSSLIFYIIFVNALEDITAGGKNINNSRYADFFLSHIKV